MNGKMLVLAAITAALSLARPEPASALPIFARRYNTSCTTCHAMIPKLNPFGVAFRNNGYRIPLNDEKFVRDNDISLGAPAWKKLWPEAVWPGKIPNMPPIAFRAATDLDIQPSQPDKLDFNFPSFLSLYFAGPAGDTVSFFGDLFLLGSTNSVLIDRAYGQFRLMPEKPGENWLVLKVGRIDMRAEPFSSTYRRITSQSYNVSTFKVYSDVSSLGDHDAGIELWGAVTGPDNRGGLEYAGGVVQGTDGKPATDNAKDYYWDLSYKFGGEGVVGSRRQSDTPTSIKNYEEKSISIGTIGYRGKDITALTGQPLEDQLTRTGAKFDAYYNQLNLYGAVVLGHDNVRNLIQTHVGSSAYFAEADYMLFPWVMPLLRLEKTNFNNGQRNTELLLPGVEFAVRANVRLGIEGHFFNRTSSTNPTPTGVNMGLIRMDFAF